LKKSISLSINLLLVIIILVLLGGTFSAGNQYDAGTQTDPIVTLSYVESRIETLNNSINERLLVLESQPVASGGSLAYEVLQVQAGQTIHLEANTHFILRSGEATGIAGQGGGLSDLTVGIDVQTGEYVQLNHLLLIPKTDGRVC